MAIIRGPRPESSFYTVDKQISEDERLSWAARGMLIFLLGKHDGWSVSVPHLINETQFAGVNGARQSGRDAVKAILSELAEAGYLTRSEVPRRKEDGTVNGWDYFISEVPTKPRTYRLKALRGRNGTSNSTSLQPHPDKPHTAEPYTAEPHTADPQLVNNEFEASTEGSKKPSSSPAAPAKAEAGNSEDKAGKTYPDEFLIWWQAYPRKQGKLAALKRWQDAIKVIGGKRADAIGTLLAGALRYAKATELVARDKVKMAEGWLSAGRWDDEETPEASSAPLDWWLSAPGFDAKAKELGIPARGSSESPHAFRLRVLVAAGPGPWQDAELTKAERDNASGYVSQLKKLFGYADIQPPAPAPAGVPRAEQSAKTPPPTAFRQALADLKAEHGGKPS